MKLFFLFLLSLSLLEAETFDLLLKRAYAYDPTLKTLRSMAAVSHEESGLSDIWENPVLKAGVTDIQPEDITARDLEPMQTQFVALSQKFPLSDRFGISREIAEAREKLIRLKIEDRKRQILSKLSGYLYKVALIDRRLQLLQKNSRNLHRIRELLKGYQADEEALLQAEASLMELQSRKILLEGEREVLKAEIAHYTGEKRLPDFHPDLRIVPFEVRYDPKHPYIARYRQEVMIAEKRVALFQAKERPDITVSAGYYQRVDRKDYLSLTLAVPLHIRAKERRQSARAKLLLHLQHTRLAEIRNRFATRVAVLHMKLQKARANYRHYRKSLLPLQKRIGAYLKAKERSGTLARSSVLEQYNRMLSLEARALQALDAYFQNYSKLRYYL